MLVNFEGLQRLSDGFVCEVLAVDHLQSGSETAESLFRSELRRYFIFDIVKHLVLDSKRSSQHLTLVLLDGELAQFKNFKQLFVTVLQRRVQILMLDLIEVGVLGQLRYHVVPHALIRDYLCKYILWHQLESILTFIKQAFLNFLFFL